jgi:chromosome segregation ATPase
MPDLNIRLVERLMSSADKLRRLKSDRRDLLERITGLQTKAASMADDITAKRQEVRQLAQTLKPDLDDV